MLWYQDAQNIGLSNHQLKSMLTRSIWSQCMPVPDRQTNRWADGWTSCQQCDHAF